MKLSTILIISVMLASSSAVSYAETHEIQGSDTLHSAMALAIKQARLSDKLSYVGGGSGKGEQALIHGTQGIAPMSRRFSDAAISTAGDKGIHLEEHLIGLDGIGILVNGSNPIISLDLNALRKIYTCEVTQWSQLPGQPSDSFIRVLRRDNESGTTDTFKNLVGIKEFGPCVQVVASADEILRQVTGDANAIGYAGASGSPIVGTLSASVATPASGRAYYFT